ncbi:MAG: major tail protein [Bacillota bacterium]|nr:major tail protein [Bacillota bacterium]
MATETRVRTRRRGLKNIYIAAVTTNTTESYAAATPIKLGNAISAKISDKFEIEKLYSDDGVEEVVSQYTGSEIEFEVNSLAPQDRRDLLGNLYDNGFLVKGSEDTAPEIAIGFCSKKKNGKYEFTWYYCGSFGNGLDESYETQADKIKTQTNTLKGNFYARQIETTIGTEKRHLYAINVDEANLIDANADAKAAVTDWFTKVQEHKAAA